MSDKSALSSSMEVLARIDQALESSGLKIHHSEREPLPLFLQLLDEWLLTQAQTGLADRAAAITAQARMGRDVRRALQRCYEETCSLCRAHGTLSEWTRRELDNHYQQLLQALPPAAECRNGGY